MVSHNTRRTTRGILGIRLGTCLLCVLLIALAGTAAPIHAGAIPRTAKVAAIPGYRAGRQRAHDDYLAKLRSDPLTHVFPAGVLVRIQREAEAEAARDSSQRRARPGRFCGAAAWAGVSPPPQLSLEDVFDPSKLPARTEFSAYPFVEASVNMTRCVGDELQTTINSVHEVHDTANGVAGMKEVLAFVPEGEVWTVTIPAALFYGAKAIDMINVPDFCMAEMIVRVENVWSQRLPIAECRERLNEVLGYDVAARDARYAGAAKKEVEVNRAQAAAKAAEDDGDL